MQILHDLHDRYISGQKRQQLIVEGDTKVYEILRSLKCEYGEELNWLLPYPGDWHLLKNFQVPPMKAYYDAGLKSLAIASGYPPLQIQHCSNQLQEDSPVPS